MNSNQKLSEQEHIICNAVVRALTNKEIAEHLNLVEGAVRNQITAIFRKMNVRNRVELALVYNYLYGPIVTERDDPDQDCQDLSKLKHDICRAIVLGLTNNEIAETLHRDEGAVRNQISKIYIRMNVRNRVELAMKYYLRYQPISCPVIDKLKNNCQDHSAHTGASLRLRKTSDNGLPIFIPLALQGTPFVIGRDDILNLIRKCNFEFPKNTGGVSHRHAEIEQTVCGYFITDLNSRAGTFVNGKRIKPNEPCMIQHGAQVSFGNNGADYIFEAYRR